MSAECNAGHYITLFDRHLSLSMYAVKLATFHVSRGKTWPKFPVSNIIKHGKTMDNSNTIYSPFILSDKTKNPFFTELHFYVVELVSVLLRCLWFFFFFPLSFLKFFSALYWRLRNEKQST